mmetsp:Transcript_15343/g.33180  ORF Transcript_15343/g.33180 Transcript_15343/m.33180 type:complete len:240 (-) Transcript_15343:436-1155(-)
MAIQQGSPDCNTMNCVASALMVVTLNLHLLRVDHPIDASKRELWEDVLADLPISPFVIVSSLDTVEIRPNFLVEVEGGQVRITPMRARDHFRGRCCGCCFFSGGRGRRDRRGCAAAATPLAGCRRRSAGACGCGCRRRGGRSRRACGGSRGCRRRGGGGSCSRSGCACCGGGRGCCRCGRCGRDCRSRSWGCCRGCRHGGRCSRCSSRGRCGCRDLRGSGWRGGRWSGWCCKGRREGSR